MRRWCGLNESRRYRLRESLSLFGPRDFFPHSSEQHEPMFGKRAEEVAALKDEKVDKDTGVERYIMHAPRGRAVSRRQ